MASNKPKVPDRVAATNRKASHDYILEDKYEAGIVLYGWEVKSIRQGRVNLKESYIVPQGGELYLVGAHVSPTKSVSTHVVAEPTRKRKLLLHRVEINRLVGAVERKGYSMVPMQMYWSRGKIKILFALGKGKKQYDKRSAIKARDVERDQQREFARYQ